MTAPEWEVREGDCLDLMRAMPEGSVDAVVTDPPAGIGFMSKSWDSDKGGRVSWVAWLESVLRECVRVLKPGGHSVVWSLPRTSHWTGTAIEQAGFEVRDVVTHLFGSGFPKSHNLPGGLGTALKPAAEFWWLARKPLIGTVAANHAKHGTGALNIDGCRIGTDGGETHPTHGAGKNGVYGDYGRIAKATSNGGRWPANVALDEEAARALDEQSGALASGKMEPTHTVAERAIYGQNANGGYVTMETYGDFGGASRFFYTAKASRSEREAGLREAGKALQMPSNATKYVRADGEPGQNLPVRNTHPTVKPVDLMRWLVRLVTPAGGLVLDPFTGSGTTGIAALEEGCRFLGMEREPEYVAIARARIGEAARQGRLFTSAASVIARVEGLSVEEAKRQMEMFGTKPAEREPGEDDA